MEAKVDRTSLFFLLFAILGLSSLCLIDAQNGGFSVELIHRDSPKSPFHNPWENTSTRVTNALQRSFNRVRRFQKTSVSAKVAQADISTDGVEYLMRFSIGTPSFDVLAVADTGSDLIWTQCNPCSQCFQQNGPIFDPIQSSTYKNFPCNATQCKNLANTTCSSTDKSCQYSYAYGDESFTKGNLAADTLTLPSTNGSPEAFPETVIGCGHNNNLTVHLKTQGIVGLGAGNLSLITQLGASIEGKFSYCLMPLSKTEDSSKLNFGSNAIVSGKGTVSTPLTKKSPPLDTFYFLTMEGISVGSNRVKFTGSTFGTKDGYVIIDSGTTLSFLPQEFYSQLTSAVSSQIQASRLPGTDLLCYDAASPGFSIPDITIHFTNADVKLQDMNTFILVSDRVACFTFAPAEDGAIYGNLAQMNFLVGYDIVNHVVSFMPTDCSKTGGTNNGVAEIGLNLIKNAIFSLVFYFLI